MSWHIFPTINNVGSINGKESSILAYEPNFLTWAKNLAKSPLDSFVFQGLTLSSPANQTVRIASGYAIIDSFLVYNDANVDISGLTFSSTYRVIATLNKDGNNFATSITPNATSGAIGVNSVIIGQAVVAGSPGAVTTTDSIPTPRVYEGSYIGNGATDRDIFLGFSPKILFVAGDSSAAGVQIFSTTLGSGASRYGFFAEEGTPSYGIDQSNVQRAEITTYGFRVSATGGAANGLNLNTGAYKYVAIA